MLCKLLSPARITMAGAILMMAFEGRPALAEGGRASGRVVDEAGKPVSDIRLHLVTESGETAPGVAPIEVKKGRFTIPSFPSGWFRLEVEGDAIAVKRFEIEVRGSDGTRLGDMGTEVPLGAKAPVFSVGGSQRADVKLVVGQAAVAGVQGAAAIQAARATSASLQKLNDLFTHGDMTALLAESEKVLESKPALGGALYLRGVALWKTGRPEEAVTVLRKAAEQVPDQPGIHGVLGTVLLDLATARKEAGQATESEAAASEAADAFAKQIAATPDDTNTLTNRVIALERAGHTDQAMGAIEALLAKDPTNAKALYRMAELLMDAGRNDEALAWLEKVPTKDATTVTAIYNVGVNLFNKGKMEAVAGAMRKAIAIAPETPFIHELLGRALVSLGDMPGAVREFKEFLRLAPNDPEAEATRTLIKAIE